jgi:hypothetical protein
MEPATLDPELLGNGTGAFPTFATYPTGSGPHGVTVGDFNRDGWPDLAVADGGSGTVSILINKADGSGTFLPKVDYAAAGGGAPLAVAAGFNAATQALRASGAFLADRLV